MKARQRGPHTPDLMKRSHLPPNSTTLSGHVSELQDTRPALRNSGFRVTSIIRLRFPQVKHALQAASQTSALDCIYAELEDDYRTLTDLRREAKGSDSVEHRMLASDYRTMQVWYKATRTHGNLALARNALMDMCSILSLFAKELEQYTAKPNLAQQLAFHSDLIRP